MINLSFDELRLIAQIRNINDYENKYKEGFIRALSEPKPETLKPQTPKPKPETQKPETKPKQTPKPDTKLKPEPQIPKVRAKTNKTKLRKLRKDFDELRHKFSKKRNRYRKTFYVAKNKKNIFLNQK